MYHNAFVCQIELNERSDRKKIDKLTVDPNKVHTAIKYGKQKKVSFTKKPLYIRAIFNLTFD